MDSNSTTSNRNDDINVNSAPNSSKPSKIPAICLAMFAANTAYGALVGSIFGYGAGLVKKKGFKQSFVEAKSNAKTFAILNGVDSLVVCILARLRGKHDVINAGVAGCCTGLVLSYPGPPQELLQSCFTFGVVSLIIEGLSKKHKALAMTYPISNKTIVKSKVPPPLSLSIQFPLSSERERVFSCFHKSLKKRNKDISPTSR